MRFGRLGAGFGRLGSSGSHGTSIIPGVISAGIGSYTWSGDDLSARVDHTIAASGGAYTYTGQDASLLRGYSVAATGGSYTYTGQDATLTKASGAAALTFRSAPTVQWGNNLDFNGISIGTASSDRIVIVCAQVSHNTGNTIALTVNGNTPTSSGLAIEGGDIWLEIYRISVTTGTTCDINVTASIGSGSSANIGACNLAVYTATGATIGPTSTDDTAYAFVIANPLSVGAVTVPSNGFAVAAVGVDRNFSSTWGSKTVDAHQVGHVGVWDIDLYALSIASSGSQTFTSDSNGTVNYGAIALAWGP